MQIARLGLVFIFVLSAAASAGATKTTRWTQNVRIGEGLFGSNTAPQIVYKVDPEYTEQARRQRLEGNVTVQAEFDIAGNVKVLRLVKGLGSGLDENALIALSKWRFTPAYSNGARVRVVGLIDIRFSLDRDLYVRGIQRFDRNSPASGRLLLQTLINTYPESDYLPPAKYAIADSYYSEGTTSALTRAAAEFKEFISFFPSSPLIPDVNGKLRQLEQVLGTVK